MRLILLEPAAQTRVQRLSLAALRARRPHYDELEERAMPNPDEVKHWENHYRERPPWDTGRVSPELQRRLAQFPIPRGRAIELGCGTGTNAVWLAQQGFDVTAVDICEAPIAAAEGK